MSLTKSKTHHFYVFCALFAFLSVSCKRDTFNETNDERVAPVITLSTASNEAEAYEGQTINAAVSMEAQAGIASIQIIRNGEPLETIEGVSGQVIRDYIIQYAVSEGATVGSNVIYDFMLEDRQGRRVEQRFTIRIINVPDFEFEDVTVGGNSYKLINLDINSDITLTNDHNYLLRGKVSLIQNATITIEEGTTIYAEADAALIVSTGTKIIAEGTSAAPIKFTAISERTGTATAGSWLGLFIQGLASTQGTTQNIITNIGQYGGTDEADNSGSLRYVEIAYAGAQVTNNSYALNGALNLNGVGNGTQMEYIYVNNSGNSRSGILIAGGTVQIKYLFVHNANGRAILWREGYTGYMQFVVAHYDEGSGAGSWNDGFTAFDGYDAGAASSSPIFTNVSIQGGGLPTGSGNRGVRFRTGTRGSFYNSWINGTGNPGLRTDVTTNVIFSNSRVWGNSTNFNSNASAYNSSASPYFNSTESVAITDGYKGIATSNAMNPTTLGAWFSPASYIGAVDPANDWTVGWVNIR